MKLLDGIQLEFEDLRDEADWVYGSKSPVVSGLTLMEKYLNDVVEAGFGRAANKPGRDDLEEFMGSYSRGSRFATDFKVPYHTIRQVLR